MPERVFDRIDLGKVWHCVPPARLFWAYRGWLSALSRAAAESLAAE